MPKPILCLDFDGVCHSYISGWQGVDIIPDPPVEGLEDFLKEAMQVFDIHIYSSRSSEHNGRHAMAEWFVQNISLEVCHSLRFPITKPSAFITIDDRAITFTGTWPDVQELLTFKPWNKK